MPQGKYNELQRAALIQKGFSLGVEHGHALVLEQATLIHSLKHTIRGLLSNPSVQFGPGAGETKERALEIAKE